MSRSILENQNTNQFESILKDFSSKDIKIIIGIFDLSTTIKLFCQVYKRKMYGKNYQWIILGINKNDMLYASAWEEIDCTREQVLIALNGSLQTRVAQYSYEYEDEIKKMFKTKFNETTYFESLLRRSGFEATFINYVNSYVLSYYDNCVDKDNFCLNSYFNGYAFDALLAIFKLLSELIENKRFYCNNRDFQRNIDWFSESITVFNKMSFKGITVSI
jgi:hypothetical protein